MKEKTNRKVEIRKKKTKKKRLESRESKRRDRIFTLDSYIIAARQAS